MAFGSDPVQEVQQILAGIGAPDSISNQDAFNAWQRAEGGSAANNPFDTTQGAAGTTNYNSVGVKNYRTSQQGVQATIQTLENGHYAAVLKALREGTNAYQVAAAVGASPWGTSGSLMDSILKGMKGAGTPGFEAGTGVALSGRAGGSGTRFDENTFRQQVAQMLFANSNALASGQMPSFNLAAGIQQARQAATQRVNLSPAGVATGAAPSGSLMGAAPKAAGAVRLALKQVGLPYVWGGETARGNQNAGFDCSGLVQWAYGAMGIKLPRTAAEQGQMGQAVKYTGQSSLRPGDLLVENNGDHIVMYIGGGKVVQAPHTGSTVQVSPLSWFPSSQYRARRIV